MTNNEIIDAVFEELKEYEFPQEFIDRIKDDDSMIDRFEDFLKTKNPAFELGLLFNYEMFLTGHAGSALSNHLIHSVKD
jgi:hypothetical protein